MTKLQVSALAHVTLHTMLSMLSSQNSLNGLLYTVKINSIQFMQTKAENILNPYRYQLSDEAKKRLRWIYIIRFESGNNITQAANRIGISREWLSKINSTFKNSLDDPRSLEPESRAPHHTDKRKRISQEAEDKIVEVRDKDPWGKVKIAKIVTDDWGLPVSPSTANRYMHKHKLIDPKISARNSKAWKDKLEREKSISLKIKARPPSKIKDYKPGALVEKDMKLVPKINYVKGMYRYSGLFYYQQSFLDSFTKIRLIELTEDSSSRQAVKAYRKVKLRLPFTPAAINNDNGGENEGEFSLMMNKENIIQFFSRNGTPTDNPRVERSHLTDEKEFYQRGNIKNTFQEQKEALRKWEHTYNFQRPHQALGYLTPMKFYELWKKNPAEAYKITEQWQQYLKKQRARLANSRKIKRKEQIEKLMIFIDAKLSQTPNLKAYKLQLTKCELCS
jgi:hypothetical protein